MPSTPYVINGTIKNSNTLNIANARITFTTTLGSVSKISDSTGKYVLDLANAGYTVGETVSYSVIDSKKNEIYEGTFEVSGANKTINITLGLRTNTINSPGNKDIQIHNIGGEIVSQDNPFHVIDLNLPDNYKITWTITRTDMQPDAETIVLKGVTYKRTFTYNASNVLIERSEWVRQ